MTEARAWSAAQATRIGSAHLRESLPLQDAADTWVDADDPSRAVIAVADGHGHHLHFRSDVGARLAVDRVVVRLRDALDAIAAAEDPEQVVGEAMAGVVADWQQAVLDDVAADPLPQLYDEQPHLAYGTTLLAAAVVDDRLVLAQIGDGDSIVVSTAGQASRPIPDDPSFDGVYTTSLCQDDPLSALQMRVVDLADADVGLVALCTDGFGKSQADPAWWRETGRQLVTFARAHGMAWVAERLPGWLDEPAEVGGDDTTIAILSVIGSEGTATRR